MEITQRMRSTKFSAIFYMFLQLRMHHNVIRIIYFLHYPIISTRSHSQVESQSGENHDDDETVSPKSTSLSMKTKT